MLSFPLKNKNILYLIIAIIILAFISGSFWFQSVEKKAATSYEQVEIDTILAPEVETVLTNKIALVSRLVQDPIIIEAVKRSNQKNKNLSSDEIVRLDKKWRNTEGIDEFINSFLTNEVALKLIEFQEDNAGFPEIFIADMYGLNVGQTNKTTDYYQADEDWWVDSYAGGQGKSFHGPIEFDESAQAEAIAVYVPIIDQETKRAIGVTKAIVDIVAIKAEL